MASVLAKRVQRERDELQHSLHRIHADKQRLIDSAFDIIDALDDPHLRSHGPPPIPSAVPLLPLLPPPSSPDAVFLPLSSSAMEEDITASSPAPAVQLCSVHTGYHAGVDGWRGGDRVEGCWRVRAIVQVGAGAGELRRVSVSVVSAVALVSRSSVLPMLSSGAVVALSATVDVPASTPANCDHIPASLLLRFEQAAAASSPSSTRSRLLVLAPLHLPRWPMGDQAGSSRVHRPLSHSLDTDIVLALEPLLSPHRIDLLVPSSPSVASTLVLVESLLRGRSEMAVVDATDYAAVAGVQEEAAMAEGGRLLLSSPSSTTSSVCCVLREASRGCLVRVFSSSVPQCATFVAWLRDAALSSGCTLVADVLCAANLSAANSLLASLSRETELAVGSITLRDPPLPLTAHCSADELSAGSVRAAVVDGAVRCDGTSMRCGRHGARAEAASAAAERTADPLDAGRTRQGHRARALPAPPWPPAAVRPSHSPRPHLCFSSL